MGDKKYKTTKDIEVAKKIVDQVIGQEEAVEVVRKAALRRRHLLLVGEPGTGKSMLGKALSELLPTRGKLEDVLVYPNEKDNKNPKIKVFPAGDGEKKIIKLRKVFESSILTKRLALFGFGGLVLLGLGYFLWGLLKDVEYGALALVNGLGSLIWIVLLMALLANRAPGAFKSLSGLAMIPKPLILHKKKDPAPFEDATGAHSGALLGDVMHDPFQSGGLGTPAHERVVPGMIHRASGGVLFVDEIANLRIESQQELLTALQEKKYHITGQSERSAGSMVRTEPVPCDFVLVAAGNYETIKKMHPALRSRIRGYGYEVYMKETMPDNKENRFMIARFVAQEVEKDKKIPHFTKKAVDLIIQEAKRRAERKGHLTLRFRELGGLVRAAGDIALKDKSDLVKPKHVLAARSLARPLEQQIADEYIGRKKEYEVIVTEGLAVGRVNGLAVMGSNGSYSGILLPIEAEVTPGGKEKQIVATGKLGEIAKEAVKNVSAIIKKYFGEDIKGKYDLFVQFLQTYEGVEGDSASIAVATGIISALKNVPVKQELAMTGSLSVRGEVLPVGGVSSKVEAAIDSGIKKIIVPKANEKDIVIEEKKLKKAEILPVEKLSEVLELALEWKGHEDILKLIKDKSK